MNFKFKTTGEAWGGFLLSRLMNYCKPDKEYLLQVMVAKEKRSLSQNEYYFAVVIPTFMKWTGYTKEESHQYLKGRFLGYFKKSAIGPLMINHEFTKSTTKLNTVEFESYLESCRHFIYMEFNDTVPLPNQISEEQLIELEKLNKY